MGTTNNILYYVSSHLGFLDIYRLKCDEFILTFSFILIVSTGSIPTGIGGRSLKSSTVNLKCQFSFLTWSKLRHVKSFGFVSASNFSLSIKLLSSLFVTASQPLVLLVTSTEKYQNISIIIKDMCKMWSCYMWVKINWEILLTNKSLGFLKVI